MAWGVVRSDGGRSGPPVRQSAHTDWIWCVTFTDRGNALLSGSRDGTLRLWRALSFARIADADFRH